MPPGRARPNHRSLASRAAPRFSSLFRSRGIAYFIEGRVQIVARTGATWTLRVRGSANYAVQLTTSELARGSGTCSCPAFADLGTCKHLWAAILELDLLLGARTKLGAQAPMFATNARGDVVGWRSPSSRALCANAFTVDEWGKGAGSDFGDISAVEFAGESAEEFGRAGAKPARRSSARAEELAASEDDDDLDDEFDDELSVDQMLAEFTAACDEDDKDDDKDDDEDWPPVGRSDGEHADPAPQPQGKPSGRMTRSPPSPAQSAQPRTQSWRQRLRSLNLSIRPPSQEPAVETTFLIDGDGVRSERLRIWVAVRKHDRTGRLGAWRLPPMRELWEVADAAGQLALRQLLKFTGTPNYGGQPAAAIAVEALLVDAALTALASRSVRLWSDLTMRPRLPATLPPEVAIDAGVPFSLSVTHVRSADGKRTLVGGHATRGDEVIAHAVALLEGWLFTNDRIVRIDLHGAAALGQQLLVDGPLDAPRSAETQVLATIAPLLAHAPMQSAVADLIAELAPTPVLGIGKPDPAQRALVGRLSFDYAGIRVASAEPRGVLTDGARLLRRDAAREQAAATRLRELGASAVSSVASSAGSSEGLVIRAAEFLNLAQTLLAEGWQLEAEGRPVHRAGFTRLAVRSAADWFDVHGSVEFAGRAVPLPEILQARDSSGLVRLGDGSFGLLPERWLARWAPLAALGDARGAARDGAVRLRAPQAWLIDMLIAERAADTVQLDAAFERRRQRLRKFAGLRPAKEPAGFAGELRPYQREGLGWLKFLQEFGLGGCLADDMGLGKTAQVLALLVGRTRGRKRQPTRQPTLVVAPRSVVFHWRQEAARFAPRLRVLEHVGTQRWSALTESQGTLRDFDVVLTTYGTLVRDVEQLSGVAFHLVVLDEANAIKNAASQRAKAALALCADHRLALSGTPIENSLDELWSLFEFLNPGMLGRAGAFRELLASQRGERDATAPSFGERLRQVLRPFFLRRTKEAVLRELPGKSEQVVLCTLEGSQRRDYEQLRDHYRGKLRARIATAGLAKSKMHVLEALLRLRQLACHRGLIDRGLRGESSAKLEVLLPMLDDVVRGGHKALVFSQFTSLLAIVRERLQAQGVAHEYLDGQTTKRQAAVERFQSDPACPVFLLSIKAGGVGLNLTAADYVFLLDPWWNPAVEAQAIDRAHRIGQTRPVFAYRLIARDTIEAKLLDLQRDKRALAAALFADDDAPLRDLTAEDLEQLLT